MNDTYTQLLTFVLVLTLIPAAYLTYATWPRRFIWIFRGEESAMSLAMTMLTTLALLRVNAVDTPIPYPGMGWSIFTLLTLSVISSLVWGRVSKHVRHHLGNRRSVKQGIEQLREMGMDVSQFDKKQKDVQ